MPHSPQRFWLHLLLFLLTLLTTTVIGARLAENFDANRPAIYLAEDIAAYHRLLSRPEAWLAGLAYSCTLLAILLAHEMGHYLTCRRYGLDATLPYFIPFPSVIGTLGAFIRIRSPIYYRRVLFDVGIAGPLAGFAVVLPAAVYGIWCSKVVPGISAQADLQFGTPLFFRILQGLLIPGASPGDIALHPVAQAAWVGVFATALNLLPIGQLDGGHILYAVFPARHRLLSRLFLVLLLPLGLIYPPWLVWAAILLLLGSRHPLVYDFSELDQARKRLAILALGLFLLCFMVAPIETRWGD
ncbi:MAG: site-2 protease family protein [Bryobacteraceae bacterium]|nr:site-2 protease family protein [Bryobacteraceae bacterium]